MSLFFCLLVYLARLRAKVMPANQVTNQEQERQRKEEEKEIFLGAKAHERCFGADVRPTWDESNQTWTLLIPLGVSNSNRKQQQQNGNQKVDWCVKKNDRRNQVGERAWRKKLEKRKQVALNNWTLECIYLNLKPVPLDRIFFVVSYTSIRIWTGPSGSITTNGSHSGSQERSMH